MTNLKHFTLLFFLICAISGLNAQGFLHADGTRIVDGNNENFLIRSIGTGNWMIMEGYMMKSTGAGIHTHTEFRNKLEETIGKEKTDSFYNVWLENHFTKQDMDSMKAWGFNTLRPALHYKWFTLPIEDEPVAGEQTWLDKGFIMLDSLISWATANQMYLILDMHGTPGGQGTNKDISDYDPSKPSLWESEDNKRKLVELWYKIAERYKDEVYVGGYDLINETNWDFENNPDDDSGWSNTQNIPLIEMHKRLIDTIRLVDNNHLVFVSGNSWGNNYNGMNSLAAYDDNLAYTFHKYWNYNDQGSVDWILDLTQSLNVPIWMSEGGENSNTWYTNAIRLFEDNNIGWSWWPVKKASINNVMSVTENEDYSKLINYWKNGSPSMTEDEVFQAVLTWANNHKLENTTIMYDVIDAMTRQTYDYSTKPFKNNIVGEKIFFSDYDLGRNNYAYFDKDTANHNSSIGSYTNWNQGWAYRNDGIDIEQCTDTEASNGYNVGWTQDDEWMQYTLNSDSLAAYTLTLRHASGSGGSIIHVEVNNIDITGKITLPGTGGWQNWETSTIENIILPAGKVALRIVIDQGGSNLNYFSLTNPISIDDLPFEFVSAKTSNDGKKIMIDLNKEITSANEDILVSDFTLNVNLSTITISSVYKQVSPSTTLIIEHDTDIYSDQDITISYNGASVKSDNQNLVEFTNEPVLNNLPEVKIVPGKIQAEDFYFNNGFNLEDCEDTGNGKNTSYANAGDYLDYLVHVKKSAHYEVKYRVATPHNNAQVIMQVVTNDQTSSIDTIQFTSTGDWQNWETQNSTVYLDEGYYTIRLLVKQGEHNLNWFSFTESAETGFKAEIENSIKLFPNPAQHEVNIQLNNNKTAFGTVSVYNLSGELVLNEAIESYKVQLNTAFLKRGIYLVKVTTNEYTGTQKLILE